MSEFNLPWYYNPETINETSASMVLFGAEHFKRAYVIKHLNALKQMVTARNNDLISVAEFHAFIYDFFFEKLTDAIKICIFFENYMKAVLLSHDYLIYTITKGKGCDELENQQKKRPIKTKEFHNKKNFDVDEQQKTVRHDALANHTLNFSTLLLKEKYQEVINLPRDIRDFLKVLANQRNAHHFISEWTFEMNDTYLNNLEMADKFVDDCVSRYVPKS